MNQALIVVTSYARSKPGRVYHGLEEWCDGWKFLANSNFALRKRNDSQVSFPANVKEVLKQSCDEDVVIWMRGKDEPDFPADELTDIIDKLTKECEVYVAGHDEFVPWMVPSEQAGRLKRLGTYTLSTANSIAFKEVMRDDGGHPRLNPLAPFDKLFSAFFLVPADIFGVVEHKVSGLLGPLDIQFQLLVETSFSERSWKGITEQYPGQRAKDLLRNCKYHIYNHRTGLRRLYEEEKKEEDKRVEVGGKSSDLKKIWERLVALLPDDDPSGSGSSGRADEAAGLCREEHTQVPPDKLYLMVIESLDALCDRQKERIRFIFSKPESKGNTFQTWYAEFNEALKKMEQTVMREHSQPAVGA